MHVRLGAVELEVGVEDVAGAGPVVSEEPVGVDGGGYAGESLVDGEDRSIARVAHNRAATEAAVEGPGPGVAYRISTRRAQLY